MAYRGMTKGNVKNAAVRFLLTELGDRLLPFTKDKWKLTCDFFGNKCAYTGVDSEVTSFETEHVYGANQTECGLYAFGNTIPASKAANAAKNRSNSKSLDQFLSNENDFMRQFEFSDDELTRRKERINQFMVETGYDKLHATLYPILREALPKFYADIENSVQEFANKLSSLLPNVELGTSHSFEQKSNRLASGSSAEQNRKTVETSEVNIPIGKRARAKFGEWAQVYELGSLTSAGFKHHGRPLLLAKEDGRYVQLKNRYYAQPITDIIRSEYWLSNDWKSGDENLLRIIEDALATVTLDGSDNDLQENPDNFAHSPNKSE